MAEIDVHPSATMDDEKTFEASSPTEVADILWEQFALILEEHFHVMKLHKVRKKPLGHK